MADSRAPDTSRFVADATRIRQRTLELARYGKIGETGVDRLAFTDEDEAAHQLVRAWMRDNGLETRVDAFGNLFGRRPGRKAGAPVVLTGSHLDGPPLGGMFDGTVGVVCGLEALQILDACGVTTEYPLELVAIRCEHLDRFGLSCLGSRALAGKLGDADLDRLHDDAGITLRQALTERGYLNSSLASVDLRETTQAFVELHIEQGRVLEDAGARLGLVTHIAGPTRYRVALVGRADHSGGTPMRLRADALCGAAEVVLALERIAAASESSVGTVGVLRVEPGAMHTIPGRAELLVDIRGVDIADKERLVGEFEQELGRISGKRQLGLSTEVLVSEPPIPCAPTTVETIAAALDVAGLSYLRLASGGGHDAQHLAARTAIGMIFIPSIAGISHTPQERTSWDDLAHGAVALAVALERLGNAAAPATPRLPEGA